MKLKITQPCEKLKKINLQLDIVRNNIKFL